MGLGTQTGIASITGDTVGSVGRRYEVEENLDDAIGLNAMFVPIGDRLASYGAAKITVKEEDWQKTFARLASASQLIFMMPGPSASALWELSQIMQSRKLLEKTVFIMPPESSSSEQRNPLAQFARSPGIDRSVPGLWKRVGEMAKIRAGCSLDVQLGRALESDIGDVP